MTDLTRKKIVKWFWILFTVPFILVFSLLTAVWLFADIPSFEELENPRSNLATQIIAEGGEVLCTFHIENRSFVTFEELPEALVHAAIATEDVRFYDHSGIDFRSLARVLVKTLLMSNSAQGGGSTITQQLAKTLYPREDMSSSIPGVYHVRMVWVKLKEWITAVKLERNYTKDEIMTMYMNQIFFGSGASGIKAASRTFYGKTPQELGPEECAMLVGMVNKPTRYNPHINPDKAIVRRNFVLGQMTKAGYLSKQVRDSLQQLPVEVPEYQVQDHNAGYALYYRDMLRNYMRNEKPRRSAFSTEEEYQAELYLWENDDLYGWLNKNAKADGTSYDIDRDGLRIHTTINFKMQKYAEEAVAEHLGKDLQPSFWRDLKSKVNQPFSNDIEPSVINTVMKQARRNSDRYRNMKKAGIGDSDIMASFDQPAQMRLFAWNGKGYVDTTMTPNDSIRYCKAHIRVAFMAMEPGTGRVKAYVGGPNYRFFKFDNISQSKRQVGSTVKPFLYTLAMQEGLSPCTKVVNLPQTIDGWTPRSTDKPEWIGKTVTLKWGLTMSSNNISTYLMKQYGPQAMVKQMRNMGVTSYLDPVPSLCVGAAEVSLKEMVAAYNIFPSHGVYVSPLMVTRIEDSNGNLLSSFTNVKKEVAISEATSCQMVNLMQSVVNNGTGGRLRGKYALRNEIAGKTGTTNDNSDGWFIGYTPKITAGVWAGAEDRQIHFQSIALGQGSNMALPVWALFMKKVLADGTLGISNDDHFTVPEGLSLDAGCLDVSSMPAMGDDYFD
ncbi:MAG: transglycosylase domain-containing protein [Bacteroidales bacterium]|nr:transglycosylase domain-containing protein [Bacteroidales bacterium]